MIRKQVRMFNKPTVLACDGRCNKAWGINGRPKVKLGRNVDDYVFVADSKLGTAPGPGETNIAFDGGDSKPSAKPIKRRGSMMNRWCARECERCGRFDRGEDIVVPDLEHPKPNMQPAPDITKSVNDLSGMTLIDTGHAEREVRIAASFDLIPPNLDHRDATKRQLRSNAMVVNFHRIYGTGGGRKGVK